MPDRTAIEAELDRIRADVEGDAFKSALAARAMNPGDAAANLAVMTRLARILVDLQTLDERASRVPAPRRDVPRRELPGVVRGDAAASIAFAALDFSPATRFYYPTSIEQARDGTIAEVLDEVDKNKAAQTIVLDGTGRGVLLALEPLVHEYLRLFDVPDEDDAVASRTRTLALSKLFFGDSPSAERAVGGLTDILVGVARWVAAQARSNVAYAVDAGVLRTYVDWLLLKTTLGREYVSNDDGSNGPTQANARMDADLRALYATFGRDIAENEPANQLLIGSVIPYTAFRNLGDDANADSFFARVYAALVPADDYRVLSAPGRSMLLVPVLGDAAANDDRSFNERSLDRAVFRLRSVRGVAENFQEQRKGAIAQVQLAVYYAQYLGVLVSNAFAELAAAHTAPTNAEGELVARFIYTAMLWFTDVAFVGEDDENAESAFERIGERPLAAGLVIESAARLPTAASLATGITLDLIRDSLEGWIADQAALDDEEGGGLKQFAAVLYETLLGSSAEALKKLVGTDGLTIVAPDMETVRSVAERKTYVSTHVFKPVRSFDELKEGRALALALGGGRVRVTTRRSRFAGTRLLRIGDDVEQRVRRVIKLKQVRIIVVDSWEPSVSARQAAASTERALASAVRAPSAPAVARALAVTSEEERVSSEALLEAYGEALATNAPADVHEAIAAALTARGEKPATVRAYVSRAVHAAVAGPTANATLSVAAPRASSAERIAAAERAVRAVGASRLASVKQVAHAERRAAVARAAVAPPLSYAAAAAPSQVSRTAAAAPSQVSRTAAPYDADTAATTAALAEDARVEDALLSAALSAARTAVPSSAPARAARSSARAEAAPRSASPVRVERAFRSAAPARAEPASRSAAPVRTNANAVIADFNGVLNKALDTIKASSSDGAMFDAVTHVHTWYDSHTAEANAALEPAAWTSAMEALRTSLEEKGCVDESSTAYEHVEALAMLHRLDTA